MWWHDTRGALSRAIRAAAAVGLAGLLAGCFQPLYGERSATGEPVLRDKFAAVNVAPIKAPNGSPEARLAVEVRNALLFNMNGGDAPHGSTYRLDIQLRTSRTSVIVDINTARPDIENYGIDATYTLSDITGPAAKPVVTGQTFARVSYDIPGGEQRFARVRALRDAENRAAGVIAEQIRNRLASYFVAGT
jgi:LPS-assembly lipoprotein